MEEFDDTKLLRIQHTTINKEHVTHINYSIKPEKLIVYFVSGQKQIYRGSVATRLWKRLSSDLEVVE